MRIYAQISMDGTELSKSETRAKQAVPMKPITELVALKRLKKMGCDVVPDLLGFQEETQGPDGFVPGGFITFVVWEKVAGEPLGYDEFWNMNYNMRDSIRRKFRATYPYVHPTLFFYFSCLKLTSTHRLESFYTVALSHAYNQRRSSLLIHRPKKCMWYSVHPDQIAYLQF